jgi:tetraacyldisaccharide 4'-kinase
LSRKWLAPLTPVYAAALAAKNAAFGRGWLQAKRLRWPVVSVGNLSFGGSGKTPLTIWLAELLSAKGLHVDVLSRGYGRSSHATERVDPQGNADRFGDEPLLITRRTGVPVWVGASRYEAGLLAEENRVDPKSQQQRTGQPAGIHLLDDGFQHRQLARAVDIVVVHRSDFTERLLPAGRLREPMTALRRADFVVVREEDAELEKQLRGLDIHAPIWWMKRSLSLPPELTETTERVVAFCGIARPEEFFSAVIAREVNVELAVTFADHHRYSNDDVERLARVAKEVRAAAFVITEKDSVKLDSKLTAILEAAAPIRVAPLDVTLRNEADVIGQLQKKLLL